MTRNVIIMLVLLAALAWNRQEVISVVHRAKHKLNIVGRDYAEDVNGVVRTDPLEILIDVNSALRDSGKPEISLDVLALARAIESEHGDASQNVRIWVAWTIRNAAGSPDKVFRKLVPATSGFFAHQNTDGRYAATNQSATMDNIDIARMVLNSMSVNDPTHGATNFFSPKTQDYAYQQYLAGNPRFKNSKKPAAQVKSEWTNRGLVSLGAPPGAKPGEVEFFGKGIA